MPPVIGLGQQPCGFFPRRYLFAKLETARRLQADIGGDIVFFCHDSDHDPRETRTLLHHRKTGEPFEFNFTFDNPLQRKFSPLYLKRVRDDWRQRTALQLPAYLARPLVEMFQTVKAATVADFCLEMYRAMGLLDGVRVERSSNPALRQAACDIDDYFVDVPFEGEIVRARHVDGELRLHKGGDVWVTVPSTSYGREQISPTRDSRLKWMQSVLHCTHYVSGAGEQDYLRLEDAPDVTFVKRMPIDRSDEAYTP
ncbi:MAG TPA: hypothetical protein VGO93_24380 [Candidatus Xenobia bacterium]|jgi:hypothetical protein